ncbi:MAG: pyridoxal phosphate-dependent aminotransferase [Bdellovibrionales bacterium]|nr:pyridoxal phosphate-dependent aminotransferase [Bdellovibrionales bacterium]
MTNSVEYCDISDSYSKHHLQNVDLAVGAIPSLFTSEVMESAWVSAYQSTNHSLYGDFRGELKLKCAIEKMTGTTRAQLLITNGASESISIVYMVLRALNRNLRSFIPESSFPSFFKIAEALSIELHRYAIFNLSSPFLSHELFERLDLRRNDVVWINSPGNPSGTGICRATLQSILNHTQESGTFVVLDDVYGSMYFQPNIAPIIDKTYLEQYPNLIVISSLGKLLGQSGIRVGYIATNNKKLLNEFSSLKCHLSMCTGRVNQFYAARLLEHLDESLLDQRRLSLLRNFSRLRSAFISSGFQVAESCGGPFLSAFRESTTRPTENILGDLGILSIPLRMFGAERNGARLCIAKNNVTISEICNRLTSLKKEN